MDKNFQMSMLYEFYGALLTEKQAYIIDSYFNNDLSLSEIADNLQITRQGVLKQVKDTQKILLNYEEKLELMKSYFDNKEHFEEIINKLCKIKNNENANTIKEVLAIISKMY